jgi:RNA polymerase sigma-70 factor, ECF subfamily
MKFLVAAMTKADVDDTVALVHEAQKGSREALERLFERFAPFVRRIVMLRLGGAPARRDDVDDLVQDALLRAYESLETFGTFAGSDFRKWLARCARCAVFDDYKRVRALKRGGGRLVRNFTEWGSDYFTSSLLRGKGETPSQYARVKEREEEIFAALQAMEERHCRVILYRKFCDLSYEEIAEALGLGDAANARALCHRALKRLKERIGD